MNPLALAPSDHLGHQLSVLMMEPGEQRDRLTAGIYLPTDREEAIGRLEYTLTLVKRAEGTERKVHKAVKTKKLAKIKGPKLYDEALAKGVITQDEFNVIKQAEDARWDAIQVDHFSQEEYHAMDGGSKVAAGSAPVRIAASS